MRERIFRINGFIHEQTIGLLTRMKLIVSIPYKNDWLVARWGVNKSALLRKAKQLSGEK